MSSITIQSVYSKRPRHALRNVVVFLGIFILLVWSLDVFVFQGVSESGAIIARNILRALFEPNLEAFLSFNVDSVWYLMFETLGIALLGTLLGGILSLPFALLTARNIVGEGGQFNWQHHVNHHSIVSIFYSWDYVCSGNRTRSFCRGADNCSAFHWYDREVVY